MKVYMDHTGLNTFDTIVHSLEFLAKDPNNCNCELKLSSLPCCFIWRSVWELNAYGVSADSDIVYRGQVYRVSRDGSKTKGLWYGITKPELPRIGKRNHYLQSKKFDVYYA